MASSMTRANAVSILVDYYNAVNNPIDTHDSTKISRINALLADVMAILVTTNTDGAYGIALTSPKVTIVPYSSGTRPYKIKGGAAFSYTIATTGGETTSTPVTFSTTTALPSWVTLNPSTGVLSGTAPAVSGSVFNLLSGGETANVSDTLRTPFMVSAKTAFGESTNGPIPFQLEVTNPLAPGVTSAATGSGVHAGSLVNYTITASGSPTSFVAYDLAQLNAGAVPGTISLNATTGVISGNLGSGVGSLGAGTYTIYVAAVNAYGEGLDQAVVITLS